MTESESSNTTRAQKNAASEVVSAEGLSSPCSWPTFEPTPMGNLPGDLFTRQRQVFGAARRASAEARAKEEQAKERLEQTLRDLGAQRASAKEEADATLKRVLSQAFERFAAPAVAPYKEDTARQKALDSLKRKWAEYEQEASHASVHASVDVARLTLSTARHAMETVSTERPFQITDTVFVWCFIVACVLLCIAGSVLQVQEATAAIWCLVSSALFRRLAHCQLQLLCVEKR